MSFATRSLSTTLHAAGPPPGTAERPDHLHRHRRTRPPSRACRSRPPSRARDPSAVPTTTTSPRVSVPSCTSTVATGPRPLSSRASSTTARGATLRIGLELEQLRLELNQGLEQLLETRCPSPRRRRRRSSSPPKSSGTSPCSISRCRVCWEFAAGQVASCSRRRRSERSAAFECSNGLDGLGHDALGRGDDEDHEVGELRAAGAHLGEGGVARRVDEGERVVADTSTW